VIAAKLEDILEVAVLRLIAMMILAKTEDLALPLILAAVLMDILEALVLNSAVIPLA